MSQNIGERKQANNGFWMEIIDFRQKNDIDIKFDDGTIVKNKKYSSFINGSIAHPNISTKMALAIKKNLHKRVKANNGMWVECIAYRSGNDIDVQFEDGTIVEHVNCSNFIKGAVTHPDVIKNDKVGQTNIAKNGLMMTIIEYNSAKNVTIEFEDGNIVTNKSYENFKNGTITHPTINAAKQMSKNTIMNEKNKANNGLQMTIIGFRSKSDIDVQFEDGIIVEHTSYVAFKEGRIAHPNLNTNMIKCRQKHLNEKRQTKNGI